MERSKIAILGATSHIAKGLIAKFLHVGKYELFLFTRSEEKLQNFISSLDDRANSHCDIVAGYEAFSNLNYDVIINCVGTGTIDKMAGQYQRWFSVTEEFDNLCMAYLREGHPDTLYISLSSGVVHGNDFSDPVDAQTHYKLQINNVASTDYYGIARIYAESKHRANPDLNIVDLRLFSYFSRFIELSDRYLMCDIINCLNSGSVFQTYAANIIRDYISPHDLFGVMIQCMSRSTLNAAFDVASVKPISKMEILDYFQTTYGLRYQIVEGHQTESGTGNKLNYFSSNRDLQNFGYVPAHTSLDTLISESRELILKPTVQRVSELNNKKSGSGS